MRSIAGILCVSIGAALAGAPAAAETSFYVGVSAGEASSNLTAQEFGVFVSAAYNELRLERQSLTTSSVDDGDTTFAAFGGLRFSRYLAIELMYTDLGDTTFRYTGSVSRTDGAVLPLAPGPWIPVQGEIVSSSRGFGLKALGALPLGEHFDVHAHVGIFMSETEMQLAAPGSALALRNFYRGADDSSQEPFYGVGAAYRLDNHWTFSLDWQQFADLGISDEAIAEGARSPASGDARADAEALTLAVRYAF
jgi:hypothetical protein